MGLTFDTCFKETMELQTSGWWKKHRKQERPLQRGGSKVLTAQQAGFRFSEPIPFSKPTFLLSLLSDSTFAGMLMADNVLLLS